MKSQDIVILLKLVSLLEPEDESSLQNFSVASIGEDPFSARGLESSLGISKSEVNASINRSLASGLAMRDRKYPRIKPNHRNIQNFIVHGLKFVFPPKLGAMERGIPTAFAAPMLNRHLISASDYNFVWPNSKGKEKGQSIDPLFKSVPEAVGKDRRLYESLALIDAIRVGKPREVNLASKHLEERLLRV
ncbi:MAG: hypothetical protein ACNYPF_04525 [Candidatus Puniceispirillales bacterium WSBS_2018_MAG_OTU23]